MTRRPGTGEVGEPTELPVDPEVGLFALRYPSGTRGPKLTHDVALLLGESGPFWQCYCEDATIDDNDSCKHVRDARRRWVERGRHDWMRRRTLTAHVFCRSCSAVRQADGRLDAAPCRRTTVGPPGISLRSPS